MNHFTKRAACVGAAVITASLGGVAQAQPAGGERATALQEIVVTARRREESLQSVPITITAFDDMALEENNINTTQDLQYAVPGVFLTGSGSRSNTLYAIRGQAKPVIGQGSSGVLTYFADVPLPTNASSVPQYDIGSIQVLKGPQGTLFGRNSTGGAILTYPKKPTYDFGGYVEVGAGNYDYRATTAAVNIPLVDNKVALRLATQFQHRDGYTDNNGLGHNPDQLDSQSFRASLLVEPNDMISNLTILDYHENDASASGAIVVKGIVLPSPMGGFFRFDEVARRQELRGPRDVELNLPSSREDFEQFGFTNRTDIDFGSWNITNIIGYRYNNVFVESQIDGMGALPFSLTADGPIVAEVPLNVLEGHQKNIREQFTEELQIKGTAMDDRLEWLVGLFYLKSEPDGPNASATGFFQPTVQTYQFLEEESKAVFVNFGYDLSAVAEGLTLNLGARQTWDESELCTGFGEQPVPGAIAPTPASIESCGGLNSPDRLDTDSDALTWTVGLDWQVNNDLFAYITSRKGYRAGGINGPKFSGALVPYQTFEPEETVDVELGLRSDWYIGDVSGRLNVAVFRTMADDAQVAASGLQTAQVVPNCDPVNGPVFIDGNCDPSDDPAQTAINQNVGETQIDGIELQLTVMPTDLLTLDFTATMLDSETESFDPPAPLAPFYPPNEIPILYTPEKSATAGIRYELPIDPALGQVVLNADYYYSDEVEMIGYVADSYEITNFRADWREVMGSSFDISAFVRNAFDEEAVVAPGVLTRVSPFGSALYSKPRLWGVEVQYNFGAR